MVVPAAIDRTGRLAAHVVVPVSTRRHRAIVRQRRAGGNGDGTFIGRFWVLCDSARMAAERVVSLIASATEIVCALDCGERLVGRSHECDFPDFVRDLPVCTEPKFDTDNRSLRPWNQSGRFYPPRSI